jgi:GNAT superfamily N-acetyltransferase
MAEWDALAVVLLDHRERRVAEALVGLQRASYRVEAELIGDDAIPPLHESVAALAALDLAFLAITERDGEPVAALGYQVADGVLDIDRLAVHPRRFRRGLGRRLVEAVLERVPHERAVVSTGQGTIRPAGSTSGSGSSTSMTWPPPRPSSSRGTSESSWGRAPRRSTQPLVGHSCNARCAGP